MKILLKSILITFEHVHFCYFHSFGNCVIGKVPEQNLWKTWNNSHYGINKNKEVFAEIKTRQGINTQDNYMDNNVVLSVTKRILIHFETLKMMSTEEEGSKRLVR